MIFNDILKELTLIRTALETIAEIKQTPKSLPEGSDVKILEEDLSDKESKTIRFQYDQAEKAGFMFPEDALPLEIFEE